MDAAPFCPAMLPLLVLSCGGSLFSVVVREEAVVRVERGSLVESLVGDLGFGDFVSMDLTASQELANRGVEPGDIEEVELRSFELSVVEPTGGDLAFLDQVEIYVEAEGLERRRVAFAKDFPEGEPSVSLEVDPADLTDYVVSRSMTLSSDVSGRRPDVDTEVAAAFSVRFGVTRQGACSALRDER